MALGRREPWTILRIDRIRAVTDRSIDRDPLRMLRAIRYLCTLDDFSMDENLKEEISSKRGPDLKNPR